MIKEYRKKPVIIQAVQWTGNNLLEIIQFIGLHESAQKWTWEEYEKVVETNGLKIFTLEGTMNASIGDYIIKGVQGEFYPCKPDIFEKTYESELSSNTQKQEDTWNLILEKLPPVGVEVLFQNDKWIDLDYNPKGIRIGFLDGTGDYYSAYWCTLHDEYHTRDSIDDDSRFKLKLAIDQIPIKWKEIN